MTDNATPSRDSNPLKPRHYAAIVAGLIGVGSIAALAGSALLIAMLESATHHPAKTDPIADPALVRVIADRQAAQERDRFAAERREDLQKFASFHALLVVQDRALQSRADWFNGQFQAALTRSDMVALYRASRTEVDALEQINLQISQIDVPSFNNNDVQANAQHALDAMRARHFDLKTVADKVGAMADSGAPKPSDVAAAQDAADDANGAAIREAGSILKAYEYLGIAADQIDAENGGIKR